MSFLDHIATCNTYRAEDYRPLRLGATRIGWVRHDNAAMLQRFPEVFAVSEREVALIAGGGFAGLSAAVDGVIETLVAEGRIDKWRHEDFAVRPRWGEAPLFKLDRGAVAFFGIRSYGVHLNGVRRDGAGRDDGALRLWIGRRAGDKKVAPNKLDNMVAGGIGHGHGLVETLIKEAGEEAALPPALMAGAVPVGALTYRMATKLGMREDVLFVFDLDVPADFIPRNTDGEIAEFHLMPAREIVARVRGSEDFKFNVNLVIIDFALRYGLITPDDEPDYVAIVTGLRQPLD
jgi:8-oxo-dGTP pyrophosphatase MutT (NUDIX family)